MTTHASTFFYSTEGPRQLDNDTPYPPPCCPTMEPYAGSHVGSLNEKENTPISKTTMSMVTVRLSDTTLGSLPSPTPTLKLVDDNAEEFPLNNNDDPMYALERTESSPDGMAASRRSSTESITSQGAVDWEGLERTEGESIKDETSEEVGTFFSYGIHRLQFYSYLPSGIEEKLSDNWL